MSANLSSPHAGGQPQVIRVKLSNFCPLMVGTVGLVLGWSPEGLAQDAVSIKAIKVGQIGQSPPAFQLTVNTPLQLLEVQLRCGDRNFGVKRSAGMGEKVEIPLTVNLGKHACKGSLQITTPDGGGGSSNLSFEVEMFPELKVKVDRESVDLEAKRLSASLDRAMGQLEVEVYGENGLIGGGRAAGGGAPAGELVPVEWTGSGEPLKIVVKAIDTHGFWGAVELFPWSYEVPHEDVEFESGQAIIRPSEEPKLKRALEEIRKVEARYGAVAKINLYVAGFTDTVGDGASNQRLSEARAKAIATWFRAQGFNQALFVRGLGESGLLIATPDETNEAKNRRVSYIVAAEAPSPAAGVGSGGWSQLK